MSRKDAPAAVQAPMPAPDAAALLRRNAESADVRDRPATELYDSFVKYRRERFWDL